MINKSLAIELPTPWKGGTFKTSQVGSVNFLVGPNGSGKSRFANALRGHLPHPRILGTDRLSGMEIGGLKNIWGDNLSSGLAKNWFQNFKNIGAEGSGIDALVLLEERMELRIQVEATLSHLFNRKISLEWDSGNLMPRAALAGSGQSYRLDRDECHGIKELLVLLTQLYNDQYQSLIIDEPELNLHPQYQAFLMQEVRKVAGDPSVDKQKKIIFLVTHSPFILDFRSAEDVKSVISFDQNLSIPRHIYELDPAATARLATLVPRLNVHHKQFFFSDNPIFVEGILDAQLIATMQETRGVSVAGAGSCIIDAGGCEEVNRYLELCIALAKSAWFVYDLDSLFGGNLRACVKADGTIQSFLLKAGVGNDFGKYCGELDGKLTTLIDKVLATSSPAGAVIRLKEFLVGLGPRSGWKSTQWNKARVAISTAISRYRSDVVTVTSEAEVGDVEGRLKQICAALAQRRVLLLPGGTLERYLPKYAGDPYELSPDAKRQAVLDEIELMGAGLSEDQMAKRYGHLFDAVRHLPSKLKVNVDSILREYLSRYIHELQLAVTNHPEWNATQVQARLTNIQPSTSKVFKLENLTSSGANQFSAKVVIKEMLGEPARFVSVTHQTNAGMADFKIEVAP